MGLNPVWAFFFFAPVADTVFNPTTSNIVSFSKARQLGCPKIVLDHVCVYYNYMCVYIQWIEFNTSQLTGCHS